MGTGDSYGRTQNLLSRVLYGEFSGLIRFFLCLGQSDVTVTFTNADGGIRMSPTSQCCLAGECATVVGQTGCCPESPRHTAKGNASITSDGGVPFELLDKRTLNLD